MEIIIREKDQTITYEMITNLLNEAHKENEINGMIFMARKQSVEQTIERLGEAGFFCVALINEQLVGTAAVTFVKNNNKKMKFGIIKMVCVKNEFRGKGISSLMYAFLENKAMLQNCNYVITTTAISNKLVVNSNLKHSYYKYDYKSFRNTDYYSIVMKKDFKYSLYNRMYGTVRYYLKKVKCLAFVDKKGNIRLKKYLQKLIKMR